MAATRLTGRTLFAAATIVGAALTPAVASAEPAPPQLSYLNLAVQPGGDAKSSRAAVLTCDPSGGTHPKADVACNTLVSADGDFNSLPTGHANTVCPQIYEPVTFTAQGTWRDAPVKFEKQFSNSCVAESQTGQVFQF